MSEFKYSFNPTWAGLDLVSSEEKGILPRFNLPSPNDPFFLSFVLSWLQHLVNVLNELLNVLK